MNLKFPHAIVTYDPRRDAVKFFAEDDGEVVPCAVSRSALQRRFGARSDPDDLTRTFVRNRRPIERAAQRKYGRHDTGPDGRVLVGPDDVVPEET